VKSVELRFTEHLAQLLSVLAVGTIITHQRMGRKNAIANTVGGKMLKCVLEAALTKAQQNAGFYLREFSDRTVKLFNSEDCQLAVWDSVKVTIAEIRKEANKHI